MLPKKNRLRKSKDFDRVFKKSRPVFLNHLSIRSRNNGTDKSRIGFIVSNKINKLASRRNAVKRQLRACSKVLISQVKPGYDIIVVLKSDFSYPYQQSEIYDFLNKALNRAHVLKNDKKIIN